MAKKQKPAVTNQKTKNEVPANPSLPQGESNQAGNGKVTEASTQARLLAELAESKRLTAGELIDGLPDDHKRYWEDVRGLGLEPDKLSCVVWAQAARIQLSFPPRPQGPTIGATRQTGETTDEWFKKMAFLHGYHPRYLAASSKVLEQAGIQPLAEEELRSLAKITLEPAQEGARLHNLNKLKQCVRGVPERMEWLRTGSDTAAAQRRLDAHINTGLEEHTAGDLCSGDETSTAGRKHTGRKERPEGAAPKARYSVLGKPVTAALRWMGKQGWSKGEAVAVLKHYSQQCSLTTVAIQLKAGQRGDRGEPAAFNKGEEAELRKVAGK